MRAGKPKRSIPFGLLPDASGSAGPAAEFASRAVGPVQRVGMRRVGCPVLDAFRGVAVAAPLEMRGTGCDFHMRAFPPSSKPQVGGPLGFPARPDASVPCGEEGPAAGFASRAVDPVRGGGPRPRVRVQMRQSRAAGRSLSASRRFFAKAWHVELSRMRGARHRGASFSSS